MIQAPSERTLDYNVVMYGRAKEVFESTLAEIREAGLFKEERVIVTPQSASIGVGAGDGKAERHVLNFCANNYLGLSSHPTVIEGEQRAGNRKLSRGARPPARRS